MAIELNVAGDMVRLLPGDNEVAKGAVTVYAMVKRLADRGAVSPIFALYDATGNKMAGLFTAADGDNVRLWADWGEASATNIATLANDEWTACAFIGDDSSGSLKLRGYVKRPGQATASLEVNGVAGSGWFAQLILGNRYDSIWFDGRFTDVRIWGAALGLAEFEAEAASASPVRTTNLLVANDFTGANLAEALSSDTSNDTWTGTWETDGSTPTVSTDAPSYSAAPTVSGNDTLPQASAGSAPGAPTLSTATVIGARAIQVTYTSASGTVDGYRVYVTPSGGTRYVGASVGSGDLSAVVTNLAPNTSYTVDVVAFNSAGEGTASSTLTRTTLKLKVRISKVEKTAASVTAIRMIVWLTPTSGSPDLVGQKIGEVTNAAASSAVLDAAEGDNVCTITADLSGLPGIPLIGGQTVMAQASKSSINRSTRITTATVIEEA